MILAHSHLIDGVVVSPATLTGDDIEEIAEYKTKRGEREAFQCNDAHNTLGLQRVRLYVGS